MSKYIELYDHKIVKAELADKIREAELLSMRTPLDACVILDNDTGQISVKEHEAGWITERISSGADICLYRTNNSLYHAFSDWFTNGTTDEDINAFVHEIISPAAWAEATEAAEGDPRYIWRCIPAGWEAELDAAVIDQFAEDILSAFDPQTVIERICEEERQATTCVW